MNKIRIKNINIVLLSGISLFLTGNVFTNSSFANNKFAGTHLGASMGLSSTNYHHLGYDKIGNQNENHRYGNSGFATALSVGYLFPLTKGWLLGPDLHMQHNAYQNNNSGPSRAIPGLISANHSFNWNYGASAKLGYALSSNNMFYGMIGPEAAFMKSTYIENSPESVGSNSGFVYGAIASIGAEQKITKNIYIAEQINYAIFNLQSTPLSAGDLKKNSPSLLGGLIYIGLII
ncbi:outer membrane protein [Legionella oakridgensis]|uniref:outer membrane protein n=1 Tax=Legionella oakridgensis TaxID=29423 RepID=UPI0003DE203C|nr:outer membrane beta-barrel protein [Legionella oakridgensis]ETO93138.1 opacity protein [Legionella oakridgensis RV-2-2007]